MKPRLTLLPQRALLDAGLLMAEQEDEHGDRWLGRDHFHHADAAARHLAEWAAGVTVDEDSGHSPLIHVAVRALMAWEREQSALTRDPAATVYAALSRDPAPRLVKTRIWVGCQELGATLHTDDGPDDAT